MEVREGKKIRTNGDDDEARDQQERCHFPLEIVEDRTNRVSNENAERYATENEAHDFRPFVLFRVLRGDQRHPRDADARGGDALDASSQEQHFVSLAKREHCNSWSAAFRN